MTYINVVVASPLGAEEVVAEEEVADLEGLVVDRRDLVAAEDNVAADLRELASLALFLLCS
jgi:hypothetical protein